MSTVLRVRLRTECRRPRFHGLVPSGLTLALAPLLLWSSAVVAQASQAPAGHSIPPGAWDDDWWYPEGRIVLFGQRYSLMSGVTFTRFAHRSTRDAFGPMQTDPSVDLYRPDATAGLSPDFDFLWIGITGAGNSAGYVAPTLGVRFAPVASARKRWIVPYVSLRGGPYFARTSTSGSATVLGANAAIGVSIARRIVMKARYDFLQSMRGHDLSTLGLDVAVRIPIGAPQRAQPKMHDFVPPPGRLVDVGGHHLHIVCLGSGSPTVVLDAGMSDAWVVWDRILPELARTSRVCAYDRAGIGYSDPGPLPRDSRRIVKELHILLERSGERPLYVLVGHSFGGYNVRLFASQYRDEVAGMVLVDATHENIWSRYPVGMREQMARAAESFRVMAERGEKGRPLPPVVPNLPFAVASRSAWYRALYEEMRTAETSADELRSADRTLTVPLVVVTAGKSEGAGLSRQAATEMRARWRELQIDLVQLSPQGVQVIAQKSGHYVQRSEPRVVIDAVRRVVELARMSR